MMIPEVQGPGLAGRESRAQSKAGTSQAPGVRVEGAVGAAGTRPFAPDWKHTRQAALPHLQHCCSSFSLLAQALKRLSGRRGLPGNDANAITAIVAAGIY